MDAATTTLVLDVSDLLAYFAHNRAPTGIQRVQIEIARELASAHAGSHVSLTRLSEATGAWKQVSAAAFDELIAVSKTGADVADPQWIAVRNRIDRATLNGPDTFFPPRAVLVNLGSSWWSPNYFLHIRRLKRAFGTAYVPLIYDMIPLVDQESCAEDLVTQFIGWVLSVLDHADFFLSISQSSKADLIGVAAQLGRTIAPEEVQVIPLDADYRAVNVAARSTTLPAKITGPFVLLVSTIEYRKNQLMALDAWRELMNRHGADRMPQLVLVGKIGNQGDRVVERLTLDPDLARRVVILSGIDDAQLATLYGDALFTLYPSRYEGWGLPVTESLCFGKAALVARNSSLPEAGGDHVAYFDTASLRSLIGKLESLLFDPAALAHYRERAATFRARIWPEISEQVRAAVTEWREGGEVDLSRLTPVVRRGGYYPLRRNSSTLIWHGMGDNERFRAGGDWYGLEAWGCWAAAPGGRLAFGVSDDEPVRLSLRINVPGHLPREVTIMDSGLKVLAATIVEPNVAKWMTVKATPVDGRVELLLRGSELLKEEGSGRLLSIGLSGLFVFTDADAGDYELVEAIALGSLLDHDPHRRPFPARRAVA